MDYKFEGDEIYVIEWEDINGNNVLSIGAVLYQHKHCVVLASRWKFTPDYIQYIPKQRIKKVYHLGFVDENDNLQLLWIKTPYKSGYGC